MICKLIINALNNGAKYSKIADIYGVNPDYGRKI